MLASVHSGYQTGNLPQAVSRGRASGLAPVISQRRPAGSHLVAGTDVPPDTIAQQELPRETIKNLQQNTVNAKPATPASKHPVRDWLVKWAGVIGAGATAIIMCLVSFQTYDLLKNDKKNEARYQLAQLEKQQDRMSNPQSNKAPLPDPVTKMTDSTPVIPHRESVLSQANASAYKSPPTSTGYYSQVA